MSGDARILIGTSPGQSRALYLVDGQVVEAWHDFHHDPDLTGRVYRVRTDRVFPAQNRATATLEDGTAISVRTTRHDRLKAGETATVTLVAAPRDAKPWQAVTGARLAGKNIVLLPGGEGIASSQRMIRPPAAPVIKALQSMIEDAPGYGVILRRHAGASEDLAGEAAALVAAWRAGLRDVEGADCLFDNGGLAARIAVQEPHLPQDLVGPDGAGDFDALWDRMIDESTRSDIPLAGGGVMWVEPTRQAEYRTVAGPARRCGRPTGWLSMRWQLCAPYRCARSWQARGWNAGWTPPTGSAGRAPLPWRRLTGRSSLLFRPMLDQPPSSRPQDDDIRQAGRCREDRRRRSGLSDLRRTGSSAGRKGRAQSTAFLLAALCGYRPRTLVSGALCHSGGRGCG